MAGQGRDVLAGYALGACAGWDQTDRGRHQYAGVAGPSQFVDPRSEDTVAARGQFDTVEAHLPHEGEITGLDVVEKAGREA